MTKLNAACISNNLIKVKRLIAAGVKVNQVDNYGNTPLHLAAWRGEEDIIKTLISAGSDVNKANKYGETPLHWAVENGNEKSARLLAKHIPGAKIYQYKSGAIAIYEKGFIRIDRHKYTVEDWLTIYKKLGAAYKCSTEAIAAYGRFIKRCVKLEEPKNG